MWGGFHRPGGDEPKRGRREAARLCLKYGQSEWTFCAVSKKSTPNKGSRIRDESGAEKLENNVSVRIISQSDSSQSVKLDTAPLKASEAMFVGEFHI